MATIDQHDKAVRSRQGRRQEPDGRYEAQGTGIIPTETVGIPVHASPRIDDIVALVASSAEQGDRPFLVTFVNPGAVALAERDPSYRAALARFDLVLPDGIGMAKAVEWVQQVPATRISFDTTSLAPPVLHLAQQRGHPVALVGGKPGVAQRACERLTQNFPGLVIAAALDGYGDPAEKAKQVHAASAKIVICCMGGGAQEQFLLHLADRGWVGCGFTCGGYFDQLADGMNYYPRWIDAANLRWAYRLYREPRRLGYRYLVDYSHFGLRLASSLLQPKRP